MNKKLIAILEKIKSLANVDNDGDTFFCKEANFNQLIEKAIELSSPSGETKTIELVCKGFDGSTDQTDNMIIWIRVPIESIIYLNERSNAIKSISEIKQKFTAGIDLTIN
jgi:hypothetical protein